MIWNRSVYNGSVGDGARMAGTIIIMGKLAPKVMNDSTMNFPDNFTRTAKDVKLLPLNYKSAITDISAFTE